MKISLWLSLGFVIAALFFESCNKNKSDTSEAETNQKLVIGTWTYASSYRTDTTLNDDGSFRFQSGYLSTNLNPGTNYMRFTDKDTVYTSQDAWGAGLAGALLRDTVHYIAKDNYILLDYPAGYNHYGFNFSYPAYQDTLFIKSLSSGSFSLSRNYHDKHVVLPSGEYKRSIDSLIKQ